MAAKEFSDFVGPQNSIENLLPVIGKAELIKDILAGLLSSHKYISNMFLYDDVGSKLHEEITYLPEYYPARIEKELLREAALKVGKHLKNVEIVELGSGDSAKISILLEAVPPDIVGSISYVPVDISEAAVRESMTILESRYPALKIHGIVTDFIRTIGLAPIEKNRFFCFLGITFGNFSRHQADKFLIDLGQIMRSGDRLLIGFDMVKDRSILEGAYNDSGKVIAEFHKNILNVINGVAGTNFDKDSFEYLGFYDESQARIEIHLRAKKNLRVFCPPPAKEITIAEGETIRTSHAYKFTYDDINSLANKARLALEHIYSDKNNWFSLVQFRR